MNRHGTAVTGFTDLLMLRLVPPGNPAQVLVEGLRMGTKSDIGILKGTGIGWKLKFGLACGIYADYCTANG